MQDIQRRAVRMANGTEKSFAQNDFKTFGTVSLKEV